MKAKLVILILCSVWPVFLLACPVPVSARELVWSGCSVSRLAYMDDLAREYEKRTGVKMFVRGGGTAVGIKEVSEGKVDIGGSCRPRIDQNPQNIKFVQVAWDAVVFIVHRHNPVSNITTDDIRKIYSGEIITWRHPEFKEKIKLLIAKASIGFSGVYHSLKTLVLKGRVPALTSDMEIVPTPAILEQMVEHEPYAFGATGFGSARKRDVKMLRVNGVLPTEQNIMSGRYPFKRPLFLVIRDKPSDEVQRFIDFVLSNEGQRIINLLGVPKLK